MATALIFAGGTGQRMNTRSKPKQFLELHGKPIVAYTLEHFEAHEQVEQILVVCLESWMDELKGVLRRYDISKVRWIVPGGKSGHESIYLGLKKLSGYLSDKEIVLIHDGVRPLITKELISDNIAKAEEYGAAITAEPATESVIESADGVHVDGMPKRSEMYTAKAPQTFRFGLVWEAYQRAHAEHFLSVDSAHLFHTYDYEMYMIKSTPNNIKITSPADYYIFRALYEAIENSQIFGI